MDKSMAMSREFQMPQADSDLELLPMLLSVLVSEVVSEVVLMLLSSASLVVSMD